MMRAPSSLAAGLFGALSLASAVAAAEPFPLVWPTPNRAWAEGKPPAAWLQQAGSGDPESGGFGGVRSGGTHFHEGIDIKAIARDRRGEPTDNVFAAMPGVVRHISSSPGNSSYGRYIVLEHPAMTPAVYSLYAHLSRIAPGLRIGQSVTPGQIIATMGHSSGGYMIPVERAHLHFEIGLAVTQYFQTWYDGRRFGSRNEHGNWNGQNLMGVNPIAFYDEWRAGRLTTAQDFFARMETAVRVRIATYRTPDFVTRYPSLLTKPLPFGPVAGWEIRFNWTGLPFAWTPLSGGEVIGLPATRPQIVEVNAALVRRERSRSVAIERGGAWTAGKDLEMVLQQLFGLK